MRIKKKSKSVTQACWFYSVVQFQSCLLFYTNDLTPFGMCMPCSVIFCHFNHEESYIAVSTGQSYERKNREGEEHAHLFKVKKCGTSKIGYLHKT